MCLMLKCLTSWKIIANDHNKIVHILLSKFFLRVINDVRYFVVSIIFCHWFIVIDCKRYFVIDRNVVENWCVFLPLHASFVLPTLRQCSDEL